MCAKSECAKSVSDAILQSPSLLIMSNKDLDSMIASYSILLFRLERIGESCITHITFPDRITLLDHLANLSESDYDCVLVIGLVDNNLSIGSKRVLNIDSRHRPFSRLLMSVFSKLQFDETRDMLTLAEQYWLRYETYATKSRLCCRIATPGALWKTVCRSLNHSLWPYIPEVTGNLDACVQALKRVNVRHDVNVQDLDPDEVMRLLKYIIDIFVQHRFNLRLVDVIVDDPLVVKDDVDALDLALSMEAQLSLKDYVYGVAELIENPSIVKRDDVQTVVDKYVANVRSVVEELLDEINKVVDRGGVLTFRKDVSDVIACRVCNVLSCCELINNVLPVIEVARGGAATICVPANRVEVISRLLNMRLSDRNYIVSPQGRAITITCEEEQLDDFSREVAKALAST